MRQLYIEVISGPMRVQHSIISKKKSTTSGGAFQKQGSRIKNDKIKDLTAEKSVN